MAGERAVVEVDLADQSRIRGVPLAAVAVLRSTRVPAKLALLAGAPIVTEGARSHALASANSALTSVGVSARPQQTRQALPDEEVVALYNPAIRMVVLTVALANDSVPTRAGVWGTPLR